MRARRALGEVGSDRISQLPGLSSRGRSVLARLEVTRLWQGQAEQALRYWREYQRDPYHSRWDRPDSCGEWACCPDIDEVRAVLRTVVRSLPTRDARRLRAAIAAFGEDALESLTLLFLSTTQSSHESGWSRLRAWRPPTGQAMRCSWMWRCGWMWRCRMMDPVQWDDETRAGIEVALNEAYVLGIRLDPAGAWCDVLVHVLALPETGPLDRDARRILRLTGPGQVSILLRTDRAGQTGYGPIIPLSGLDVSGWMSSSRTDSASGRRFSVTMSV
jgi:hypothetical protein